MSAPTVDRVVELDARTRDELQPPCDCLTDPRCDRPAVWILRVSRACSHGPNVSLWCDEHRRQLDRMRPWMCLGCLLPPVRVDGAFEPLTPRTHGG